MKEIYRLIPMLPDSMVAGLLRFLRLFNTVHSTMRADNLQSNIETFRKAHVPALCNGFVEDQAAYGDMHLGKSDMCYAGCEVIAVFNAMRALGEVISDRSLPDLINIFETGGIIANGCWGTAPYSLQRYFRKKGFRVIYTGDRRKFDEVSHACRALVMTVYNDCHDLSQELHTMCVTKDADGRFYVHNSYYMCHGSYAVRGPFLSLQELTDDLRRDADGRPLSRILVLTGII